MNHELWDAIALYRGLREAVKAGTEVPWEELEAASQEVNRLMAEADESQWEVAIA